MQPLPPQGSEGDITLLVVRAGDLHVVRAEGMGRGWTSFEGMCSLRLIHARQRGGGACS